MAAENTAVKNEKADNVHEHVHADVVGFLFDADAGPISWPEYF
jgi:hypothetical protein